MSDQQNTGNLSEQIHIRQFIDEVSKMAITNAENIGKMKEDIDELKGNSSFIRSTVGLIMRFLEEKLNGEAHFTDDKKKKK